MIVPGNKMAHDGVDDSSQGEIANALIVTNLKDVFFGNKSSKKDFEAEFRAFDNAATFNYLKSFGRARVNFTSIEATMAARLQLHDKELCDQNIKCFFAQVPLKTKDLLLPPKQERMFLISPPCSPPVGWEQVPESEPVLNYELIDALSRLTPGEAHEALASSHTNPGIVVHLCEDPEGFATRPSILQTRCPQRDLD